MAVKVGSFAKSTSTSVPVTQAITGVGFTPKALIMWTVGATTANAYDAAIKHAYGMSDGTNHGCVASACDDATANSNTSSITSNKAITIINGDGTILAEAVVSAFGSDGFTLSWTTNDAVATIINFMAIGGADLTHVKLHQWQFATEAGNQAITGVGFQPDALVGMFGYNANLNTAQVNATTALSFGQTGPVNWCGGWTYADNTASGRGFNGAGNDTRFLLDYKPSSSECNASLASLDADGWTHTFANDPAAAYYAFHLCLKGGSYKQGVATKSTSAAPVDQTISGLGFTPEGVLLAMAHTLNGGNYGLCLVIGAGDGTNERCGLITDKYNSATIEAKHYSGNAKVLVQDYTLPTGTYPDQITDSEADLALALGQFTLSWTTNDDKASDFGWFALATGVEAAGGGVPVKAMHYKRLRTQ